MLCFATGNEGKFREARRILGEYGLEVTRVEVGKVEIQSSRLEDIVYHALRHAGRRECPLVIEDSGLFIPALGGFPGPYSSYVYSTIGVGGVLRLMEGLDRRGAYFLSVVGFSWRNVVLLFRGVVRGFISTEARGRGGFGFDPIFIPEGDVRTFAEMGVEKDRVSHRARAFRQLGEWLLRTGLL